MIAGTGNRQEFLAFIKPNTTDALAEFASEINKSKNKKLNHMKLRPSKNEVLKK